MIMHCESLCLVAGVQGSTMAWPWRGSRARTIFGLPLAMFLLWSIPFLSAISLEAQ